MQGEDRTLTPKGGVAQCPYTNDDKHFRKSRERQLSLQKQKPLLVFVQVLSGADYTVTIVSGAAWTGEK